MVKNMEKGYTVQFNILRKDLPKVKRIIRENSDIIVRGIWTENRMLFV